MNKVLIIGHVGQDPEMRYTPMGKAVTTFSVATSRKYKDGDGNPQEETTWFRVSAWDKLAEIANQYVHQGDKIYVEGRLSLRQWEGREGKAGATLEVSALGIELLGNKRETGPEA